MFTLKKIVEERISNLKIAIEEAQKSLSHPAKAGENIAKPSDAQLQKDKEKDDITKENIAKMKIQESYQSRIMSHILTAELIGETACTRGFVCIEPSFEKEKAELFAKYIHKAANKIFKRFNANLDDEIPLFTEEALYPKMPEEKDIIRGCTPCLKELTKPFFNVTLLADSSYQNLDKNITSYKEIITSFGEFKRYKTQSITINCNESSEKIINTNHTSGASVSIIIEDILNLVYNSLDNKTSLKKFEMKISETFKSINKNTWKDLKPQQKLEILGMLIVLCGSHKFLRFGCKAVLSNNKDQICKIIHGGDKTGLNSAKVIFLKDKQAKIEEVRIENLNKMEINKKVIQCISLKDLTDSVIESYEILMENKEDIINRNLIHFILKLLNDIFSEETAKKEGLFER